IDTEDVRQRGPERVCARAHREVQRAVHRHRVDTDQHLVRSRLGRGDLLEAHLLGTTELENHHRLHSRRVSRRLRALSTRCYSQRAMTTQTSAGWLTLHGVRLETVERGQGRPILWLHGEEGLDPDAPFLERLARHGRVIAPSHPGFGHSPEADSIDTVDDLSYLYLHLLAERGARDAGVAGASLGGWIAAELAVKCTARLARLVLVAPLGIKVGGRGQGDIPRILGAGPQ